MSKKSIFIIFIFLLFINCSLNKTQLMLNQNNDKNNLIFVEQIKTIDGYFRNINIKHIPNEIKYLIIEYFIINKNRLFNITEKYRNYLLNKYININLDDMNEEFIKYYIGNLSYVYDSTGENIKAFQKQFENLESKIKNADDWIYYFKLLTNLDKTDIKSPFKAKYTKYKNVWFNHLLKAAIYDADIRFIYLLLEYPDIFEIQNNENIISIAIKYLNKNEKNLEKILDILFNDRRVTLVDKTSEAPFMVISEYKLSPKIIQKLISFDLKSSKQSINTLIEDYQHTNLSNPLAKALAIGKADYIAVELLKHPNISVIPQMKDEEDHLRNAVSRTAAFEIILKKQMSNIKNAKKQILQNHRCIEQITYELQCNESDINEENILKKYYKSISKSLNFFINQTRYSVEKRDNTLYCDGKLVERDIYIPSESEIKKAKEELKGYLHVKKLIDVAILKLI